MKYLNVSKARASFLRLVDHLDERTAIMRNGQPVAVLLDFDDYRALITVQALARDAERLAEIQAVARLVRAGDLSGFAEVPEGREGRAISDTAELKDAQDVPKDSHVRVTERSEKLAKVMEAKAKLAAALEEVRQVGGEFRVKEAEPLPLKTLGHAAGRRDPRPRKS